MLKTGQYAIAKADGTIEVEAFEVADFLSSDRGETPSPIPQALVCRRRPAKRATKWA